MLVRKIEKKIEDFISLDENNSLIVTGIKACGKTTVINKIFSNFDNYIYFDLKENNEYIDIFNYNFTFKELIDKIEQLKNIRYDNDSFKILVIDNIQLNKKVYEYLKMANKMRINTNIIGLHTQMEDKVFYTKKIINEAKVKVIQMHTLDFEEFLLNTNNEKMNELIKFNIQNNLAPSENFHRSCMEKLDEFIKVGTMPKAVSNYSKNRNFLKVYDVHDQINAEYNKVFKEIINSSKIEDRIRNLISNPVSQMPLYATKREYKELLMINEEKEKIDMLIWLIQNNLMYRTKYLEKKEEKFIVHGNKYSLSFFDTSLLLNRLDIDLITVKNTKKSLYKQLILNLVIVELCKKNIQVYHVKKRKDGPGFDFVMKVNKKYIPVKILQTKTNSKAKIKRYMDKQKLDSCYVISQNKFKREKQISFIPLYALFYMMEM